VILWLQGLQKFLSPTYGKLRGHSTGQWWAGGTGAMRGDQPCAPRRASLSDWPCPPGPPSLCRMAPRPQGQGAGSVWLRRRGANPIAQLNRGSSTCLKCSVFETAQNCTGGECLGQRGWLKPRVWSVCWETCSPCLPLPPPSMEQMPLHNIESQNRIIESLRLEKTSEIMKSNMRRTCCKPSPALALVRFYSHLSASSA